MEVINTTKIFFGTKTIVHGKDEPVQHVFSQINNANEAIKELNKILAKAKPNEYPEINRNSKTTLMLIEGEKIRE